MNKNLLELLECPVCHQQLDWKIVSENDFQIEQAEARCPDCGSVYPVMDGIGIFLTPDLPRNDMWEQVDSRLALYLKEHPDLEQKLMEVSLETLSPTDQLLRQMILEERDGFDESRKINALAKLYTPEYLMCWNSQVEFVLENLVGFRGPVVDLASGRCYLAEKIASHLHRPVIVTDFSLRVLRRNRKYLQFLGLDDLASFVAFDARKTPFRKGAIEVMTTNLGLPNIESPMNVMNELQRIIRGTLLAISHFYPMRDERNGKAIAEAGLEIFLYKESALQCFLESGWHVKVENGCAGSAFPTPVSSIFDIRPDGLPVAPTELEWCTLRAVNTVNNTDKLSFKQADKRNGD